MFKSNKLKTMLCALSMPLFLNPVNAAECLNDIDDCMRISKLVTHLKAFQQFADNNTELPGTRFITTSGYEDTVDYIVQKMQKAGYLVSLQEVPIELSYVMKGHSLEQVSPVVKRYVSDVDYAPLVNSGSADVTAKVQIIHSTSCDKADFVSFEAGNMALIQMNAQCDRNLVIGDAINVGAKAVLLNYPAFGVIFMGWNPPTITFAEHTPVLLISNEMHQALKEAVEANTPPKLHIAFKSIHKSTVTHNIIAESREGDPNHIVMVGAHIDSSHGNAGINDNASSVATVLETALLMKNSTPINKLRFAWWTGEELGLLGSNYYVEHLSLEEKSKIASYLNFEVLGAPNGGRMIMGATNDITPKGSEKITELFENYFKAHNQKYFVFDPRMNEAIRRSDMHAFAKVGIPVGFLVSGAELPWNPIFSQIFTDLPNRINGLASHPCYHRLCDKLSVKEGELKDSNFDFDLYLQMSKAAAFAVYASAMH